MVAEAAVQFRNKLTSSWYNPGFDQESELALMQLSERVGAFEEHLSDDETFFAGPSPTYCDFLVFETLDQVRFWDPKCLEGMENLTKFMETMEVLICNSPFNLLACQTVLLLSSSFSAQPLPRLTVSVYASSQALLAQYLTHEKYRAWPLNTRLAKFGAGAKPSLVKENKVRRQQLE